MLGKRFFLFVLLILLMSCEPILVSKENFDFTKIKTIGIPNIRDHNAYAGSGSMVARSLVHHLMKLRIDVVERENMEALVKEAGFIQSGLVNTESDFSIRPVDAIILCVITEFSDGHPIIIPIMKEDKGKTVTTTITVTEPLGSKNIEDSEAKIWGEKMTTTTNVTHYKGSITETERIDYVDSRVGVFLQLIHPSTGDVIWSNRYWYNSLSLSYSLDVCIEEVVKPLKKLLN